VLFQILLRFNIVKSAIVIYSNRICIIILLLLPIRPIPSYCLARIAIGFILLFRVILLNLLSNYTGTGSSWPVEHRHISECFFCIIIIIIILLYRNIAVISYSCLLFCYLMDRLDY